MAAKAQVTNYRMGTPRKPEQGVRFGVMRFLPRGVKKGDYAKRHYFDVWLPTVAPSRKLLKQYQTGGAAKDAKAWRRYTAAYRREMSKTDARQTILALAEIAKRTPIAVGCYCDLAKQHCHRVLLEDMIRRAADGQF
jgi:uncharacterized protein YeaO (DUF488 family)